MGDPFPRWMAEALRVVQDLRLCADCQKPANQQDDPVAHLAAMMEGFGVLTGLLMVHSGNPALALRRYYETGGVIHVRRDELQHIASRTLRGDQDG